MAYLPIHKDELKDIATDIRFDILKMVHSCGKQNGHLGGCMSAVEVLTVLYGQVMNINAVLHSNRPWSDRDRFIMSKGHAGIAMYAAMKHVGLVSQDMINGPIRGEETVLYRHPKRNIEYGIECSVGSLGMGIGYSVGLAECFKREKTDQKVFVMVGDGECNEGSVWESAAYASHRSLDNLVVIIDMNGLQLDGPTNSILSMSNMAQRWSAFGFEAVEVDGHDMDAIYNAFESEHIGKPLAIIAHTIKGKGMSFAENKTEWHDNYLSDALYEQGIRELGNTDLEKIRIKAKERYETRNIIFDKKEETVVKLEESKDIIENWNSFGSKNVVGEAAYLLAEQDDKFTLIYADCANRIGIEKLKKYHTEKCYEVGISEQNAVSMASAMAHEGYHVFTVAYAPFITARVLDQVRANLAYMKAPVCLIGLGAGIASSDLGATHTAFEDISNMRGLPNVMATCPVDTYEIVKCMEWFVNHPNPMYLRVTVNVPDKITYENPVDYTPYNYDVLRSGKDVLILAAGSIVGEALIAAELLSDNNIESEVVNVRSVKPLDSKIIEEINRFNRIVTIEEHSVIGGLGSAICELTGKNGLNKQIKVIGIEDEYFCADEPERIRENIELTNEGLVARIKCFLE